MMITVYSDRGASFIGMLALDRHEPVRMRPHSPERKATTYSTPLIEGPPLFRLSGAAREPYKRAYKVGRTQRQGSRSDAGLFQMHKLELTKAIEMLPNVHQTFTTIMSSVCRMHWHKGNLRYVRHEDAVMVCSWSQCHPSDDPYTTGWKKACSFLSLLPSG